jgi:hypothetical protein
LLSLHHSRYTGSFCLHQIGAAYRDQYCPYTTVDTQDHSSSTR